MPHRLFFSLSLCLLLACSEGPPLGVPTLEATQSPLTQQEPNRTRLGQVEVLGIWALRSSHPRFGGISGAALVGDRMTAITDEGDWLSFRMPTDAAGRPIAFDDLRLEPLGGRRRPKDESDAEELVALPQGWLVSFERHHRLERYPSDLSSKPEALSMPSDFAHQPNNGGAEAVTRLVDGRLLAISEEGGEGRRHLAWMGQSGAWQSLTYMAQEPYNPSAAATLPNGDVLVVERRFSLTNWLGIRLARVAAQSLKEGAVVEGQELFRLEAPFLLDNYEAITVKHRADGRDVAYLLSDDNFSVFQKTLLMVILLP